MVGDATAVDVLRDLARPQLDSCVEGTIACSRSRDAETPFPPSVGCVADSRTAIAVSTCRIDDRPTLPRKWRDQAWSLSLQHDGDP